MLYFVSHEHKERFVAALSRVKQVHNGRIDQDYGPMFYILTSDVGMWNQVTRYMQTFESHALIDFKAMKEKEYLSSGMRV